MKKLFENLTENSRHAELDSASQPLPEFIKSLPTFSGRATCVAPLSLGEGKKCVFTLAEVFSPCRKVKFSFGFTLAEVLITLGVIGVVAALTLPTLIAKYDEMVTVNKIKRSYSEIVNALEMRKQELGSYDYKDMFDLSVYNGAEVMDGIVKYLNVVERCNANTHGCGDGYKIKPNIKVNNGQGQTSFTNPYYSERAVLSDGTLVSFGAQEWSGECVFKYEYILTDENGNYVLDEDKNPIKQYNSTIRCGEIMFNIDCHKGKNQFGYDAYRIRVLPAVLQQDGGQGGKLFDTMRTGKLDYEKYNLGDF